jgi:hypothetical protein
MMQFGVCRECQILVGRCEEAAYEYGRSIEFLVIAVGTPSYREALAASRSRFVKCSDALKALEAHEDESHPGEPNPDEF